MENNAAFFIISDAIQISSLNITNKPINVIGSDEINKVKVIDEGNLHIKCRICPHENEDNKKTSLGQTVYPTPLLHFE